MILGVNTLFYIPGQVGGTETYLLEILDRFVELAKDHQLVLFSQRDNDALLRERYAAAGWNIVCLNFSAENRVARILREQLELPWHVKKAGIDVLWSPGYTLPLFCRCPQIVTIHDMQYKTFPEDLSLVARVTTDVLVRAAAGPKRHIIAISQFTKQEILKYTAATAERIHVILEAVDPEFASMAQERSAYSEDAPYLLCVANSYPHKRVDQAVRAFGLVAAKIPHRLVLVGRPRRGEPSVKKAREALAEPERVERREGLTRRELIDLFQGASCFVFPSRYEGFGLPVLEALAAGTPVVTTQEGSIPEVGGEAVTYMEEDSDEALAAAIRDVLSRSPEEALSKQQLGYEQVSLFSWEGTARRTLEACEAARRKE